MGMVDALLNLALLRSEQGRTNDRLLHEVEELQDKLADMCMLNGDWMLRAQALSNLVRKHLRYDPYTVGEQPVYGCAADLEEIEAGLLEVGPVREAEFYRQSQGMEGIMQACLPFVKPSEHATISSMVKATIAELQRRIDQIGRAELHPPPRDKAARIVESIEYETYAGTPDHPDAQPLGLKTLFAIRDASDDTARELGMHADLAAMRAELTELQNATCTFAGAPQVYEQFTALEKRLSERVDALAKLSDPTAKYEPDDELTAKLDALAKQLEEQAEDIEKATGLERKVHEVQRVLEQLDTLANRKGTELADSIARLGVELRAEHSVLARRITAVAGFAWATARALFEVGSCTERLPPNGRWVAFVDVLRTSDHLHPQAEKPVASEEPTG